MSMTPPAPATGPLWTLNGQTQILSQLPGGGIGYVWRITFTTRSGTRATIDVPAADYADPNKVAALVTAQAETIEAVHRLEGPTA